MGLCVGLYDILATSEGLIGHGTGTVNVNVDFRLIVFRPFKGEILQGRISQNSEYGIRSMLSLFAIAYGHTCSCHAVSMDFFDDVFVPAPAMLFENTV